MTTTIPELLDQDPQIIEEDQDPQIIEEDLDPQILEDLIGPQVRTMILIIDRSIVLPCHNMTIVINHVACY